MWSLLPPSSEPHPMYPSLSSTLQLASRSSSHPPTQPILYRAQNVAQEARLDELLAANQNLMTVYVLKDDLKQLWAYRHAGYARRHWEAWCQRAMESGIDALVRFAKRLRPYLEGILSHSRHPLHSKHPRHQHLNKRRARVTRGTSLPQVLVGLN